MSIIDVGGSLVRVGADDPELAALYAAGDEDDVDIDSLSEGEIADIVGAVAAKGFNPFTGKGVFSAKGGLPQLKKAVQQEVTRRIALNQAAKQATLVKRSPPTHTLEMPMPFQSTGTVAAGATVVIDLRPPCAFKCETLWIPSAIADEFTIDSLVLGLGFSMVLPNPMPCQIYSELGSSKGKDWDIGTIQLGQALSMTFTNRSGGAVQLRGAWFGKALVGGAFRG